MPKKPQVCIPNFLKIGCNIAQIYDWLSATPEEAVPLRALIAYHDEDGAYPRAIGDPKDRALNALAGITIPPISSY